MIWLLALLVWMHIVYNTKGYVNAKTNVWTKPSQVLSMTSKHLSILAVSGTDQSQIQSQGHYTKWWKWLIPSFYDDYLVNETFGLQNGIWTDGSSCQLRLFGVAYTPNMTEYHHGGIASIRDISNMKIGNNQDTPNSSLGSNESPPVHFSLPVQCYYMSAMGSWAEDKVFLRYAIYCPIMPSDLTAIMRRNKQACNMLNSDKKMFELTLFPSSAKRAAIFSSNHPIDGSSTSVQDVTGKQQEQIPVAKPNIHSKSCCKLYNHSYDGPRLRTIFSPPRTTSTWVDVASSNNDKHTLTARKGLRPTSVTTLGTVAALTAANSRINFKSADGERQVQTALNVVVCMVQTFTNPYSGYLMWLFTKYHGSIGLTVVIYDRFGSHYEYIKELIEPYGVVYHDYTPLEILNPDTFNKQYQNQQGSEFKFYYKRDKDFDGQGSHKQPHHQQSVSAAAACDRVDGSGHQQRNSDRSCYSFTRPVVEESNVLAQDTDKQLVFDMVRLRYDAQHRVVFLDADELIAPAAIMELSTGDFSSAAAEDGDGVRANKKSRAQEKTKLHSTANAPFSPAMLTMDDTRQMLYRDWGKELPVNDEYRLPRLAAAAITPSRVIHVANVSLDGDMITPTQNCMLKGYESRNMSAMLSCWSNAMIKQTWNKYMDPAGICPFHWVHKACMRLEWNKRPKGEHMTPTNAMRLGDRVHLSHVQYCQQHRVGNKYAGISETISTDVHPLAYLVNSEYRYGNSG